MRLSKGQLNILQLMSTDWELGLTAGYRKYEYWLQKGGLGRGGEAKHGLNCKTISQLQNLELIKINEKSFSTTSYKLTEKGKRIIWGIR